EPLRTQKQQWPSSRGMPSHSRCLDACSALREEPLKPCRRWSAPCKSIPQIKMRARSSPACLIRVRLAVPDPDPADHIARLNLVDHFHTAQDMAEHRVLRVQVRLRRVGDEELTAAGVWPRIERHADRPSQIRAVVQLIANREPRSALAVTARIAVLNHEVRYD